MRVAIYARVSTDKQAEKYGISSQLETLRKRNNEKGWTLVFDGGKDAFIDNGYSGADLDRPALNRLRRAVSEGRVDVVMAYDPDRLSRKLFHQMILADEFEKQGVKLEFVTQEMGTSPEDRMFFNMRGLISEYEREKIRERTMRGSRDKARQGKLVSAGSTPFGFKYNPDNATLEEDADTSRIVRLIFYTFANEDLSLRSLADKLNRLQMPTPKGGGRWRSSTLGFMLRNEAYIGRMYQFKKYHVEPKRRLKPLTKRKKSSVAMRPKEEWIPMDVPALVPLEMFEAVQKKLERNAVLAKRNTKREYLLSGLLHCSLCGGRMKGNAIHDVPYYRCYHRSDPEKYLAGPNNIYYPCSCPDIKTELMDNEVWDTIRRLIKDPDLLIHKLRQHNEGNSQTKEILEQELSICHNRLKSIPKERKRLVEGYRKGLYSDSIMREEMGIIDKEHGELETRINELEKQLSKRLLTRQHEDDIRKMADKIGTELDSIDFKGKQKLVRLLVEKITYNGQRIEIQTIIPLEEQLCPIHRRG
ncbi:MAG: recombinase family protein, partial [Deltaproteobacteria bacterium]|nr:recombinase family protein [Deltaproteobacteria bacterium]